MLIHHMDKRAMKLLEDIFKCPKCGAKGCEHVRVISERLVSLGTYDEFYEGKFKKTTASSNESKSHKIARALFYECGLHGERARPILHSPTIDGVTLDMGCGGGRDYLASKSEFTVGIDLSLSSCNVAANHYDLVVHGGEHSLPFADRSFSRVVSIDVLGHIALESKSTLIDELFRVTKPGGRHFHFAELEPREGWFNHARTLPSFSQRFIEIDGHISLEEFDAYVRRFERAGFIVRKSRPVFGMVWPAGEWAKRFSSWPMDESLHPFLRCIASIDKRLSRSEYSFAAWDVVLRLVALITSPFESRGWGTMGSFQLERPV